MCINTCVGFTGPLARNDECPECGETRYKSDVFALTGRREPRRQFTSYPVGPQIQAIFRDPESAREMNYRNHYTQQIFNELNQTGGIKDTYRDFFDGSDYLQAVQEGKIKQEDQVLMFSTDGAQLFPNKASDCWMSIWVLFDRSPDMRYKKKCVLPGIIIPGPRKPKNLDSFLYPSFHHLSAIQQEGLTIWDAARNTSLVSHPFLALGTADGPNTLRSHRIRDCNLLKRFVLHASLPRTAVDRTLESSYGSESL
ncbi:hypothetical protein BDR05DRAFT_984087 [Suillus weaverae]|nr:hypothetical protein BDR05DRAFT_984087 [Suillus weaverae]